VAVEGWRPVEDLVRWGFGHAPVAAHGSTAGILRDQAPPPLDGCAGVDALVVSTDNELTRDGG
jgi:hypothetical protein